MKRIGIALCVMLFFGVATVSAQNDLRTGGLVFDKDKMMPEDLFGLSQTSFNLGTARSMAMAGAFTSLGGDMASMAINPAGLGMFRSNEVSITPLMSFERSSTNAMANQKNEKNRFSLGNFGIVINTYEGSGNLLSLNLGLGYNRISDFNYQYSFFTPNNVASIADVFCRQLDFAGIKQGDLVGDKLDWFRYDPTYWGAVLGYKNGLAEQGKGGAWSPTWINYNDPSLDIGHYTTVESRGYIGEYELSLGANLNNKLYFGLTMGIQSVHREQNYYYSEDYLYDNNNTTTGLDVQLYSMDYRQTAIVDGVGVNFKLGVIYRPVESVRLGFALHTPTYYSLDYSYRAGMVSEAHVYNDPNGVMKPDGNGNIWIDTVTPVWSDSGPDSYEFISPTRMLFGASYTFGSMGVISVDYERDWYNGIRVKGAPQGLSHQVYNDVSRAAFKGSNILRVGVEFKPLSMLAIRAGFGYRGSMLQEGYEQLLSSPVVTKELYYTAGLGLYVSRHMTIDLAYQYAKATLSDYRLFFAEGASIPTSDSAWYSTSLTRHNVALTLGFKF
ncbi:MAG: outer membrane protein transport protein [Alistipes sp.]